MKNLRLIRRLGVAAALSVGIAAAPAVAGQAEEAAQKTHVFAVEAQAPAAVALSKDEMQTTKGAWWSGWATYRLGNNGDPGSPPTR